MIKVVIIDYNMGNVASVEKAIKKIGAEVLISRNKEQINKATHLILPGVGAFGDGMKNLQKLGLTEILNRKVLKDKVPFLGICLGMQLLAKTGYEFGINKGLGWLDGEVVKLETNNLRLPHIGWNQIKPIKKNSLFKDTPDNNYYFVHSYHLKCPSILVSSYCNYGQRFVSSIQKENIFGTQFHPEKSQTTGLKLIENFLNHA